MLWFAPTAPAGPLLGPCGARKDTVALIVAVVAAVVFGIIAVAPIVAVARIVLPLASLGLFMVI
jgi:hypothetical protein